LLFVWQVPLQLMVPEAQPQVAACPLLPGAVIVPVKLPVYAL
jgi:hypothetical protein